MFGKRTMFTPLLVGLAALYSVGCNAVAAPIVAPPAPEPRHATETVRPPTKEPSSVLAPIAQAAKSAATPAQRILHENIYLFIKQN